MAMSQGARQALPLFLRGGRLGDRGRRFLRGSLGLRSLGSGRFSLHVSCWLGIGNRGLLGGFFCGRLLSRGLFRGRFGGGLFRNGLLRRRLLGGGLFGRGLFGSRSFGRRLFRGWLFGRRLFGRRLLGFRRRSDRAFRSGDRFLGRLFDLLVFCLLVLVLVSHS